MATQNLIESHEVEALWTEIWHLENNSDRYKGASQETKDSLLILYRDLLDYKRDLPPADNHEEISERLATVSPDGEDGIWSPHRFPRRDDEPLMWIPWAEDAPSGAKRGEYRYQHPEGLVLHWTAGRRNGLKRGNDLMRSTGMLYLLGDKDGNLSQSDPLNKWGYHAGKSSLLRIPGSVSNELIGLELQAAGMLTKKGSSFYSWFGAEIDPREVATVSADRENIKKGHYHVFTDAQCELARAVCVWLYLNNPEVFKIANIVGHDEVSPVRKTDPGGAIAFGMSMNAFRECVRLDVQNIEKLQRETRYRIIDPR